MATNTTETRRLDKRSGEIEAQRRDQQRAPLETAPVRGRPANENDPGTSAMLARLRRQPSYAPFYVAFIISLAWVAGWSFIYSNSILGNPNAFSAVGLPDTMRALALLALPIAVVFVTAYFLWRASQLRQVSEVLMQSAMRLIRPQDIATEGLTTIAQAVRSEVDLLVGGVEHAVQRAGVLEEIVHKEIAAIERAFGGNEDRIRSLVSGIENQRSALHQAGLILNNDANPMLARLETNTQSLDTIVGNAHTVLARLEGGLRETAEALSHTIEGVSNKAAEAGNEISGQTSQMERMSGLLIGELRDFSHHLAGQIDQLSQSASVLNAESSEFGRSVQGMESNVLQSMKQSIEQLTAMHKDIARTVELSSTASSDQMKQTVAELTEMLETVSGNIGYHLKSATDDTLKTVERAGYDTSQQIDQSRQLVTAGLQSVAAEYLDNIAKARTELVSYLDSSAENMSASIEQATDSVAGRLNAASSQFLSSFDQTSADLLAQLDSTSSGLTGRVEQTTSKLFGDIGERAEHIITKLDDSAGLVFGRLDEQAGLVSGRVEDTANRIFTALEDKTAEATGRVSDTAAQVLSALDEQNRSSVAMITDSANRVQSTIGEVTELLTSAIDEKAANLVSRIENNYASTFSQLEQTSASLTNQLQSVSTNVNDLLVTTSGTISAHLKETSEIVNSQMQESGVLLAQKIENSGGLVTDKLITVSGSFVQNVAQARSELFSLLETSAAEMTQRLQDTTTQLYSRLDDTTSGMTGQIEETAQKLYERLDQASAHMTGELESTALRITDHIDSTTGDVTTRVVTATDTLTVELDRSSKQLGEVLDATAERMGSQLEQTSTELSALFTANTKMMTEQLDATANEVSNAFAETAVRVTRQVSEANTLMAQRLESTSAEVTNQLDSAGNSLFTRIDQTSRDLGQRFDVATGLLERVSGDISGKIAGTGAKFAEIIDTASTQIISDLGKASDALSSGMGQTTLQITGRLEQDTGLLIGRIDRAYKEYETATQTTTTRLDDAHRKFSGHVETANTYLADQLSAAASAMDERLETISMNLTGKLEMSGSRISERLEDVSHIVERSVERLNDEMERVLASRKDALDSLVSDAGKRATEVDAVMTNYMNLIEESLAASEARARDIGRIVAEQAAAATANLEQEIRKLEANSGGQITSASRILREQHERAMASMNEMLSATASDFQQTAQDMRITAQQVVKDIDSARAELKRAILDLPEETRTNADAMRRVVSDQITALNALAEVVKRQTGTIDVSGPGASVARSQPARPENAQVRTASFGTGTGRTAESKAQILADLASSTARIEKEPKSAAANIPREMEVMVDKLNIAARDVVEAIDGTLPRDLEKSFNGGSRGVYTHRLYEGRGKRLQRLIVERYDSDRLVRARVDSYVRLFERLLDMMNSAPQSENMVEACLSSESGRIYVMLAEAAGRIPEK